MLFLGIHGFSCLLQGSLGFSPALFGVGPGLALVFEFELHPGGYCGLSGKTRAELQRPARLLRIFVYRHWVAAKWARKNLTKSANI